MDFEERIRRLREERQELHAAIAERQGRLAEIDTFLRLFDKLVGSPAPPKPPREAPGDKPVTRTTPQTIAEALAESVLPHVYTGIPKTIGEALTSSVLANSHAGIPRSGLPIYGLSHSVAPAHAIAGPIWENSFKTLDIANLVSGYVDYFVPGRELTQRDRILAIVASALAGGARKTTRELLGVLVEKGVDISNWADPVTNLSAYLSRAKDRFHSDPKLGGWGLVGSVSESPNERNPGSAGTLPGSVSSADLDGQPPSARVNR